MCLVILALLACAGSDPAPGDSAAPETFRVVVTADTHLIDGFYTCCESTPMDTSSLQLSEQRLGLTLDAVGALDPPAEALFVAGDVIHEYPSAERAFYDANRTAFDIAADVLASAPLPIHYGLGNHDYDVPTTPRETSLQLFRDKWDLEPYYAVDLHGWRFVHLDCQAGPTWDPDHALYGRNLGSFGAEQLAWLDEQLEAGLPTVLFFHNPPTLIRQAEDPDSAWPDLWAVLDAHPDVVQLIFTGHMHLWMDNRSVWPTDGFGLAATRFDHRNWWVVDLDRGGPGHTIPQLDQALWGSFFYEGQGDGLDTTRAAPPPGPEPFLVAHEERDLAALAARTHRELLAQGLSGPAPEVLPGQGYATLLQAADGRRFFLLVQALRGRTWVSLSPAH